MNSWYVITHNLHGYQVVTSKLSHLGIEVYAPTMVEVKQRKDCKGTRVSEKQLFPGYLFLRFDPEVVHTTAVSDVPGVRDFVRTGVQIATISDDLVEALRQSVRFTANKAVDTVECRNVSTETVQALRSITQMRSQVERQAALFALLEKDAEVRKRMDEPFSRITSAT